MVVQHAVADRGVFAFDDERVNALHFEAKGLNELREISCSVS
jgi:hypothetical protein